MIWMSKQQVYATCKKFQELLFQAVCENTMAEDYSNIDSYCEQWLLKSKLINLFRATSKVWKRKVIKTWKTMKEHCRNY